VYNYGSLEEGDGTTEERNLNLRVNQNQKKSAMADSRLKDLAIFLKNTHVCDVPKEFSSMPLTLQQYVTLLTKNSTMVVLETFTRAWCKEHPEENDIWAAFIYHFRRDCDPTYFFLHVKEYRKLGMSTTW
jgi:hypothetical protein